MALKTRRDADYIFYELTRSICPVCRDTIDAQILIKDGRVIMRKRCRTHGQFEALLSSDAEMYLGSLRYNKPGTMPLGVSTEVVDGWLHHTNGYRDNERDIRSDLLLAFNPPCCRWLQNKGG